MEDFKVVYNVYSNDEKEQKKAQRRAKVTEQKEKVVNWAYRNQGWLIPLIPAVIGGVFGTIKIVGKHANLHKEKDVKELFCYDRSLGHYWALRRALTNAEWLEIDKRKANGERLADILAELKVLK